MSKWCFLYHTQTLQFHEVNLLTALIACDIAVLFRKFFLIQWVQEYSLQFSSIVLSISGLMLKSFIHLEFNFGQSFKCRSIWILPYAATQFEQHHFFKLLSFFQYVFISALYKNNIHNHVNLCLSRQVDFIHQRVCFVSFSCSFHYCSSVV